MGAKVGHYYVPSVFPLPTKVSIVNAYMEFLLPLWLLDFRLHMGGHDDTSGCDDVSDKIHIIISWVVLT